LPSHDGSAPGPELTGDTVDGEWVAAVLGSSDRAAYMESLGIIRGGA
jgi:hypothetical protein